MFLKLTRNIIHPIRNGLHRIRNGSHNVRNGTNRKLNVIYLGRNVIFYMRAVISTQPELELSIVIGNMWSVIERTPQECASL